MPAFRARTTIARPRDAVFEFTADLERQSRWLLSVAEVRRLSGARGQAGSTYAQSIREGGGLVDYALEVAEVEPGECFAYFSRPSGGPGPPVRVEYRFADAMDGAEATEVELAFQIRIGPILRLFWPLAFALRRGGSRQVAVVLERLKVGLEGEKGGP